MSTLPELCESVAAHLEQAVAVFEDALHSDVPVIDQLCRHVANLRGKMLRPVLLLLAGQACGRIREEHHTLAAVVEMVHMATLIHDDVLDKADIRRNAVTVNHMTSNEIAVMLGDFLISRSFLLCSSIASQRASQIVATAAATVCEGELLQLSHRGNFGLTENLYFTIIDRKTAALTAAACELGALYTQADPQTVHNLQEYGRSVGVAFQIVDDILDITGREEQAGKTLGTDARKGKLTLPMIHHLQSSPNGSAERMLAYLQTPAAQDRTRLQQFLSETGSLDYARRCAADHVSRAVESLQCLPDSPARAQLHSMARFIIGRQF
jgi:octaprenyl-diphosphate synthase